MRLRRAIATTKLALLALPLAHCAQSTQDPLGPPCTWVRTGGADGGGGCPSIVSYRVVPTGSVRWLNVIGSDVYGTGELAPLTNVFTLGAGLPTAGTQHPTPLAGMPAEGASPYGFVLLDLLPDVPGPDTLYVADDRTPDQGGGIHKWRSDGTSFSLVATFSVDSIPFGFRGVAGFVSDKGVTLVASTAEPAQNRLILIVDNGSALASATVIAAAQPDTVFRGVSLSPHL